MSIKEKLIKKIKYLKNLEIPILEDQTTLAYIILNTSLIACYAAYIAIRLKYLNPLVPLLYTRSWGEGQLIPANYLYAIPLISVILLAACMGVSNMFYKDKNSKEGVHTTFILLTITIGSLGYSLLRAVQKASVPYPSLIDRNVVSLLPLIAISFIICFLIVPYVIRLARHYNIVTDPNLHSHPGMILKKPSARAGAAAFYVAFVVVSLIFIPISRQSIGLYIGAFLTTVIGILDDKKNLSPYLRFLLLPIAIIITMVVGDLHIFYFANPFNGTTIRLDYFQLPLTVGAIKFTLIPIADAFTVIWILWFMNMLSWSNGVDGQFSGIAAISCMMIAVLALRLLKINPEELHVARMAAIAAGASLGILPYNWHPSKIMWGFGATTIGLIIPILSIIAGTKVAVATLVLIVPTLDSLVTMARRILKKKSPFFGDRGHLHHRLLDMGMSHQQVAIFYWVVTAAFGTVALISSGKSKILAVLTIGGLVAFVLVAINLKGELSKLKLQQPGK